MDWTNRGDDRASVVSLITQPFVRRLPTLRESGRTSHQYCMYATESRAAASDGGKGTIQWRIIIGEAEDQMKSKRVDTRTVTGVASLLSWALTHRMASRGETTACRTASCIRPIILVSLLNVGVMHVREHVHMPYLQIDISPTLVKV